jgi:hypothetical protein
VATIGFVLQLFEFGVKFQVLVENLCKLYEKMVEIRLFGGHQMCFGLPSCIELSLELKLKSGIN